MKNIEIEIVNRNITVRDVDNYYPPLILKISVDPTNGLVSS